MAIVFDKVKPVHKDLYDASLKAAKEMTYPGYIKEVLGLLVERGFTPNSNDIQNVIRGLKRSWIILNAIRETVGLKITELPQPVGDEEIIGDLKLQKTA